MPLAALVIGVLATGVLGVRGGPGALLGRAADEDGPAATWSAPSAEARVIDRSTHRPGAQTRRLVGAAPPKCGDRCADAAGVTFDCGAAAATTLAGPVASRLVACRRAPGAHEPHTLSSGGSAAGGLDLARALVAGG